ncbi:AbrB/MazE/SpoVT family DNA-binding domain-containing protein [Methylocystis heyeri]|uniref:SpoVT-AbrB domain-containing protein n=1 Tax=Methylocystis heyeri TaxID=391905 RepID=A0A6B8K8T8_9HYPH|nr:hypothetical protein [Methylocystis heyeri]QGM44456.1 hypothetical protein H2LOC_001375 [Methylocystis heyeri]
MRVVKRGIGLAVRLPAALIKALELKQGEEIEINIVGRGAFDIARAPDRRELRRGWAVTHKCERSRHWTVAANASAGVGEHSSLPAEGGWAGSSIG